MVAKRNGGTFESSCSSRRIVLATGAAALLASGSGAWAQDPPVTFDAPLEQGRLVRGRVPAGFHVMLDERAVRTTADGRFVVGFGRDQAAEAILRVATPNGHWIGRSLRVAPRTWDVQKIDGLPEGKVSPSDPAVLARIDAERARIRAARAVDSDGEAFAGGFVWPVEGPRSGVYGSQRILNGQPRAPHLGVDVAAPEGTPVHAAAEGIVRLADPDLFFTGGTVIVDHGHGVGTIYAHLSRVEVGEGQSVGPDRVIGAVGKTGRATGPHLHLGLYWFDRALDPESVLPPHGSTG